MGRIDACVAADRDTFWEAASDAAVGQLREAEPGRRLIFDSPHGLVSLQLVPTGQGGTRVRLEHPGGLLASLYWRAWIARVASPPWGPSRAIATVAGVLTLAAVASTLVATELPQQELHAPRLISVAELQGDTWTVQPALFARAPEPVQALVPSMEGLEVRWASGVERLPWPDARPKMSGPLPGEVDAQGDLLVSATRLDPGDIHPRHPVAVRVPSGLLVAFASGREVSVVEVPLGPAD